MGLNEKAISLSIPSPVEFVGRVPQTFPTSKTDMIARLQIKLHAVLAATALFSATLFAADSTNAPDKSAEHPLPPAPRRPSIILILADDLATAIWAVTARHASRLRIWTNSPRKACALRVVTRAAQCVLHRARH